MLYANYSITLNLSNDDNENFKKWDMSFISIWNADSDDSEEFRMTISQNSLSAIITSTMASSTASNEASSHDLHQNDPIAISTSSDHDTPERLSELREKVFGNEIILHEIIKQVLRHSTIPRFPKIDSQDISPFVSSKEVQNLRLISTRWHDETTCYYQRFKQPLFFFRYSYPTEYGFQKDELVNFHSFLDAVQDDKLESTALPFSLSIRLHRQFSHQFDFWTLHVFFSQKTLALLYLVKLKIYNSTLPEDQNNILPELPANFKLPSLREIRIYKEGGETITPDAQLKFHAFVQSLLDATVILRKLHINAEGPVSTHWNLPRTLECLGTDSKIILNSCTSSLQTPNNRLNLPQLKQLLVFENLPSPDKVMGVWMGKRFREAMPKVEKLILLATSPNRLREVWCHYGWNWSAIKTLDLQQSSPIPLDAMQALHQAFSALVHLELEFMLDRNRTLREQQAAEMRSGLSYIFREMVRLKTLKINIHYMEHSEEYEWDSIILGTTSQKATELRNDPTLWNGFLKPSQTTGYNGVGDEKENNRCTGIKSFQQLNSIFLHCQSSYTPRDHFTIQGLRSPPTPPIISSLVFRLGFMQLPQLEHLTLKGTFSIGMENIAKEWQGSDSRRSVHLTRNAWG